MSPMLSVTDSRHGTIRKETLLLQPERVYLRLQSLAFDRWQRSPHLYHLPELLWSNATPNLQVSFIEASAECGEWVQERSDGTRLGVRGRCRNVIVRFDTRCE